MCGGTYKIKYAVMKGVGGELMSQAICSGCNFTVLYGDTHFSSSSARPTQMNIGREEVMLSFILVGRPLHKMYKDLFGYIGMDSYCSKTFQRVMTEVADAIERRQHFEVSTLGSIHHLS